ncbi:MAG: hypothetical protein M1840_003167 [Geoglossum simile]|nr:MAG: hypothetical protein M1840_003167 [Geoglossum simile]
MYVFLSILFMSEFHGCPCSGGLLGRREEDAGFHRTPWSYGTVDPELLGTNPITLRIHKSEIQKYKRLDQHSVRFNFPSSFNIMKKVVLLQSHSVHLSPPSAVQISTAPHLLTEQFSVRGNLYYPNKVMLLGSFIRVLLVEEAAGGIIHSWALLLGAWAISYICGMLDVGVDALDTCEDERVRAWYNKNIRRDQGGLNRAINKRAGRMERRSVITSAE